MALFRQQDSGGHRTGEGMATHPRQGWLLRARRNNLRAYWLVQPGLPVVDAVYRALNRCVHGTNLFLAVWL